MVGEKDGFTISQPEFSAPEGQKQTLLLGFSHAVIENGVLGWSADFLKYSGHVS